jgi:hypothetical protein
MYFFKSQENFTPQGLELAKQIVSFLQASPDAPFVNYVIFLDQINSTNPELAKPDSYNGMRDFLIKGILTPEFLAEKFNL